MIQPCARQFIRVKFNSDFQLETSEGITLQGCSTNISSGGLEMECDRCTANIIMPNGYHFDPECPTVLSVKLMFGKSETILHAVCHVKNIRRIAENVFALHLEFHSLKSDNQKLLDDFVEQENFSA